MELKDFQQTVLELALVYDPATTVTCALVYQDHWAADLAGVIGK